MLTYAGIGSREITEKEAILIQKLAKELSKKLVLFSGNACGADQAFEAGSEGKCVIFLPWATFPKEGKYDKTKSLAYFCLGDSPEGLAAIPSIHENPSALNTWGKRACVARDYHQIYGYKEFPKVSFVVYCANEKDGKVEGGTRFAVKLARKENIPTVNLRACNWKETLYTIVKGIKYV
jgi:hypothetical protein